MRIRTFPVLFIFTLLQLAIVSCQNESDAGDSQIVPKQTYKEAEKEVMGFINDQLRAVLPKVISGSGAASLSQRCTASMVKIFGNLRKVKGWTIKLLDSIGKPTAGILYGAFYSLGNYDQCLSLKITSKGVETQNSSAAFFTGMYCRVRLKFNDVIVEEAKKYRRGEINATDLGKLREIIESQVYVPMSSDYMNHFVGVCLPSVCTKSDLHQLLSAVSFPGNATVDDCEAETEFTLNRTQATIACIFLLLLSLCAISTFIHWLLHDKIESCLSSNGRNKCINVVISFSFCNNTKRLMLGLEDDATGGLSGSSVRGIIVASVAWVVLGNTYFFPHDVFYRQASSLENLNSYLNQAYFVVVVTYPLAVDTLFLCYGFFLTFNLWRSISKAEDVKVNFVVLVVQNYVKICIPVLLYIGIAILLPALGSGPFWKEVMDDFGSKCYNSWPAYVSLYSNFITYENQCAPHLWFTSCLAQLTLIGILLSWILSRHMKWGTVIALLLIVAGNVAVGVYTYKNSFPPSYVAYFAQDYSDLFWQVNYSLPLSHLGPYIIGMFTGIFVARRANHPLRCCLGSTGWIFCICILEGVTVFLFTNYAAPRDRLISSVYAGSHRSIFALCVAWVIIACSFGNGGFVNAILSWRIFDPLYKLSYNAYVFYFIIMSYAVGTSREHIHYSHMEMIIRAVAFVVLSYLVSYILFMLLEQPLRTLCSTFSKKKSSGAIISPPNNLYHVDLMTNSTVEGSCKLWSVSKCKPVG